MIGCRRDNVISNGSDKKRKHNTIRIHSITLSMKKRDYKNYSYFISYSRYETYRITMNILALSFPCPLISLVVSLIFLS